MTDVSDLCFDFSTETSDSPTGLKIPICAGLVRELRPGTVILKGGTTITKTIWSDDRVKGRRPVCLANLGRNLRTVVDIFDWYDGMTILYKRQKSASPVFYFSKKYKTRANHSIDNVKFNRASSWISLSNNYPRDSHLELGILKINRRTWSSRIIVQKSWAKLRRP